MLFRLLGTLAVNTAQKIKFSIEDISSECAQIRGFLRTCSHFGENLNGKLHILCSASHTLRDIKMGFFHAEESPVQLLHVLVIS